MSKLEARIKAVNAANAYAMELYDTLSAVFAPLVGSKIEKVDGDLLARIKSQVPALPCTPALHVYRDRSPYSLRYVVKTCEVHQGSAYYHEASVYVGDMRDGVLTKLCDRPDYRTDYTSAEVVANRAAYEAARKVYEDARSALHPFGEYDR
jgi:hypothetical protein